MNQPSVIITPADRAPYRYVTVQVWAEACDRYLSWDFQVVGNDTHHARALRFLSESLDYFAAWTPAQEDYSNKMVKKIMAHGAKYGNHD
jgi:hypothetical protein